VVARAQAQAISWGAADRQAIIIPLAVCAALPLLAALYLGATPLWLLTGLAVAALILVEPRFGLYLLPLILAVDANGADPLTRSWGRLFSAFPNLYATPVELLILWTSVSWVAHSIRDRRWILPDPIVALVLGILTIILVLGYFRGVMGGGDPVIALWETRGFISLVPIVLLVNGLLREQRHLQQFGTLIVIGLVLLLAESIWRYLTIVRPGDLGSALVFAFEHETPVLLGVLVVLGFCWSMWGPNRKQRLIGFALALAAAAIILTTRRRAGLVATEAGILVVGIMILAVNWRRFLVVAPIVAIAATIYLMVFWNNTEAPGQPARAFRSIFDPASVSERDISSDLYRDAESLNLWWTIQSAPLHGIGFGSPYPKPLPFTDLSDRWPFWEYIPHNMILWLWMRAGVGAFMLFWFLVGSTIIQMISLAKRTTSAWYLTAATGCCAFLVMLVLYSYVDLGLINPRLMFLFGSVLGLVSVLRRFAPLRDEAHAAGPLG
jgi:hypothetical protein